MRLLMHVRKAGYLTVRNEKFCSSLLNIRSVFIHIFIDILLEVC